MPVLSSMLLHGGEPTSSHVILIIGSTCYFRKSCAIRVRLFDISVNTGRICMTFEADTPQKIKKYAHLIKFPDKNLI